MDADLVSGSGEKKMVQQDDKQSNSNGSPEELTKRGYPCFRGSFIEIRVKGHLSEIWADWFEGFTIERLDNGEMILTGPIVDQAALMGILNNINRLNLTLLCVQKIDHKE